MMGFPKKVKAALEKAKDSALLAVEIYNKPAAKFKSGAYITLMIIAWTSLFHAIFFKRKVKPFHRIGKRKFKIVDGDYYYWELEECIVQYYKLNNQNAVATNLRFFIPLRNKIEHKSMPELDSSIFGECQALLLNFDELIEKEFGILNCLRESLSFSLQLFPSTETLSQAIKKNPQTKPIVDFIRTYRAAISPDVIGDSKFAFKAFLIKVTNNISEEALPIQFVNYDTLTEEQKQSLNTAITLIKHKVVSVSNADMFKALYVVEKVQAALKLLKIKDTSLNDKFNMGLHIKCWKKYKVRPDGKSSEPHKTNARFCVYDKPHQDYLFTQAWIDFLVKELQSVETLQSLYKPVPVIVSPTTAPSDGTDA